MTHDLSAIRQNATTQLDMKASAASVFVEGFHSFPH